MTAALNLVAVALFVVLGIFFFRIRYGVKPAREEGDPVHIGIMVALTLASVVALAEGLPWVRALVQSGSVLIAFYLDAARPS